MKSYSRWATKEELHKNLTKVNKNSKIEASGIIMSYDKDNLYLDTSEASSIVIGGAGSGKTQAISLPQIKTACMAGESVVINDIRGEIYERTAKAFIKNGYDVRVINFGDPDSSNCYNPLTLPYLLYKEGNKDKALDLAKNLSMYLFDEEEKADPFWINNARDYFLGIVLYLFENAKEEEINLLSVYSLSTSLKDNKKLIEEINKLDKLNNISIYLANTINSPKETKEGILLTFNQKLYNYITKEKLSNMLSFNEIDFKTITKNKTIIYIVSKIESLANTLVPLLVNQIIDSIVLYGKKERRLNIILDEFNSLAPIYNLSNLINYTRGMKIRYTIQLTSYVELKNKYGKEESELIKNSCSNIIHLLTKDDYTLEETSKLCGNINNTTPLITKEKLKVLNIFEAIIIKTRMMPIKTKIIPDWKIDWNEKYEVTNEYPINNPKELKIYEYK